MRFKRLPRVLDEIGGSRSKVYSDIKAGNFPEPVKLGERASAWIDEELESWREWRIACRDGKCPKKMTWREWHEARATERDHARGRELLTPPAPSHPNNTAKRGAGKAAA